MSRSCLEDSGCPVRRGEDVYLPTCCEALVHISREEGSLRSFLLPQYLTESQLLPHLLPRTSSSPGFWLIVLYSHCLASLRVRTEVARSVPAKWSPQILPHGIIDREILQYPSLHLQTSLQARSLLRDSWRWRIWTYPRPRMEDINCIPILPRA